MSKCYIEMPESVAMEKYITLLNLLAFVNPSRGFKNGDLVKNGEVWLFSEFGSDTNHIQNIQDVIDMIIDGAYLKDFPFFYKMETAKVNEFIPLTLPNSTKQVLVNPNDITSGTETLRLSWAEWNSLGNNQPIEKNGFVYYNSNPFGTGLDSKALKTIFDVPYITCLLEKDYQNEI